MEQTTAKRYKRQKLILSISEGVISFIFILVILFSGFSEQLEDFVYHFTVNDYLALFGFIFILGIMSAIITFPIGFYKDYLLEHKYQLSNQNLRQYFWEKTKGLLISLPIILVLVSIFYFVLKNYPGNWWLIMGTVIVVFSVVLSRLAPTLIFPLFYKFSKLENAALKNKIENLCDAVGMKLDGLFQFDMSKNTKKANAAFIGIGKSKRIILGDTLLENLTDDEILAVLAHELGHFKLKHIWKGMAIGIALNYLGLYLVDLVYSNLYHHFGEIKYSLAGLPMIVLLLTLFGLITGPVSNILSRKHERQADDFAVKLVKTSATLKTGLDKLSKQNLGDENPHPAVEFLFYSHPSTKKRIDRLGGLNEEPN